MAVKEKVTLKQGAFKFVSTDDEVFSINDH